MIQFIKIAVFLIILLQLIKLILLNNKYLYQFYNKSKLFIHPSIIYICTYKMISFANTNYFIVYQNVI